MDESFLDAGFLFSWASDPFFWVGWDESFEEKLPRLYCPDFFLSGNLWKQFRVVKKIPKNEVGSWIEALQVHAAVPIWEGKGPSWERFQENFFDLKRRFQGGLQKGVLIECQESLLQVQKSYKAFWILCLLKRCLGLHCYGTWNLKEGILGASPESLFQMRSGVLSTVALAGTKPQGMSDADFLKAPKERREHHLVVEGIISSLKDCGKLKIGPTEVLPLASLSHLRTGIELELEKEADFCDLVQRLHPTPALGAFPQQEGRSFLLEQEKKVPRARFGAPFGLLQEGESQCVVAIRNLQWTQKGVFLMAGCGITEESRLESEWEEVLVKMASVRAYFQNAWEI
jgi:menaquinone-specific isochorismate synthase